MTGGRKFMEGPMGWRGGGGQPAGAYVGIGNEQPGWWDEALALEAEDRLTEAEKVIRDNIADDNFAASIAEMYWVRMARLKRVGDANGAREALKKSSDYVFFYARMARGGGEGAAFSAERDRFRGPFAAENEGDPEPGGFRTDWQ